MTILVADRDGQMRKWIRNLLEEEGYQVLEGRNGQEALELFYQYAGLDLIILDLMFSDFSGQEVLKRIRKHSQVPVLMLAAMGDARREADVLRMGAQDFISKPFHPQVLLARIDVLLRSKNPMGAGRIQVGELYIDKNRCRVWVGGREISLTNKEYRLLLYFVENRNIALTREQILERIWGFDYEGDIRTIDTHVKMLRMDLGDCGRYIHTIRGIGYMFQI